MRHLNRRRHPVLFLAPVLCQLLLLNIAHANRTAGTIAIVEGDAYAQQGAIYYTRAHVGNELKVNEFGQYRDEEPIPAFVKWEQRTRRHLKPNDVISEGDIVQTTGESWVKILFNDDSLLDVGPGTIVQVQDFKTDGQKRRVFLKMLYGRIRSIVARPLTGPQSYQLATPTSVMGVRGTEFLVSAFPVSQKEDETRTRTEVICLHGQVSIDVAKFTPKGLVYTTPVVVNPGSAFATTGAHGLGQSVALKSLPQDKLRDEVARTSPAVDMFGTAVGANPPPDRLPGTGLAIKRYNEPTQHIAVDKKAPSSFDADHPPIERNLASPSGNFSVPNDFKDDPGSMNRLPDLRRYTGPAPVQQIPAGFSKVRVNLQGI